MGNIAETLVQYKHDYFDTKFQTEETRQSIKKASNDIRFSKLKIAQDQYASQHALSTVLAGEVIQYIKPSLSQIEQKELENLEISYRNQNMLSTGLSFVSVSIFPNLSKNFLKLKAYQKGLIVVPMFLILHQLCMLEQKQKLLEFQNRILSKHGQSFLQKNFDLVEDTHKE